MEGVDLIHLAHGMNQLWAAVSMVMKLLVIYLEENFLTNTATVRKVTD
jgi:hypothetical protein